MKLTHKIYLFITISCIVLIPRKLRCGFCFSGTLTQFLILPYLCERISMTGLPLQLRDSSGFSPDSPLVFYFAKFLILYFIIQF
jgi:hypothetical protein